MSETFLVEYELRTKVIAEQQKQIEIAKPEFELVN
jgi:hypothetical protein